MKTVIKFLIFPAFIIVVIPMVVVIGTFQYISKLWLLWEETVKEAEGDLSTQPSQE